MKDDARYFAMILEEVRSQNNTVLEVVDSLRADIAELPKREEFNELKQDVKTIKAAVTDLSHQAMDHASDYLVGSCSLSRSASSFTTMYKPMAGMVK